MKYLQIKPKDPYLAYWTKFLSPIYGEYTYKEFKDENETWIEEGYGLKFSNDNERHMYVHEESGTKKFFEWLFGGLIGKLIEGLLKKSFKKRTLHKMKKLGPEASVIVSDDILKFHNHDRREEYLRKWEELARKHDL